MSCYVIQLLHSLSHPDPQKLQNNGIKNKLLFRKKSLWNPRKQNAFKFKIAPLEQTSIVIFFLAGRCLVRRRFPLFVLVGWARKYSSTETLIYAKSFKNVMFRFSFLLLKLWGESFNSDGQQYYKHQQNEQSPLYIGLFFGV